MLDDAMADPSERPMLEAIYEISKRKQEPHATRKAVLDFYDDMHRQYSKPDDIQDILPQYKIESVKNWLTYKDTVAPYVDQFVNGTGGVSDRWPLLHSNVDHMYNIGTLERMAPTHPVVERMREAYEASQHPPPRQPGERRTFRVNNLDNVGHGVVHGVDEEGGSDVQILPETPPQGGAESGHVKRFEESPGGKTLNETRINADVMTAAQGMLQMRLHDKSEDARLKKGDPVVIRGIRDPTCEGQRATIIGKEPSGQWKVECEFVAGTSMASRLEDDHKGFGRSIAPDKLKLTLSATHLVPREKTFCTLTGETATVLLKEARACYNNPAALMHLLGFDNNPPAHELLLSVNSLPIFSVHAKARAAEMIDALEADDAKPILVTYVGKDEEPKATGGAAASAFADG